MEIRFLCLALALLPGPTFAQSVLLVTRAATDYSAAFEMELREPEATFQATHVDGREARIMMQDATGAYSWLNMLAPPGGSLGPGPYEGAVRPTPPGAAPGIDLSVPGLAGCNVATGRFVILESSFEPDGRVSTLAANVEQWCEGLGPPAYAEIRINSAIPLSRAMPGTDALPDPFAIQAQSPVRAGETVESNRFTIYGVNVAVPVSISGGEYSINGGAFGSDAGTARHGDHVVVRARASLNAGGMRQALFVAGERSATFSIATYLSGTRLTGLSVNGGGGEYVDGESRLFLAPLGLVTASRPYGRNDMRFHVDAANGQYFDLYLVPPDSGDIAPGAYENASRWPFQPAGTPGLDFDGNGAGCSEVSGRFVVHEATYAADGSVASFAVDFERRCGSSGTPLVGELRFHSAVPFTYFGTSTCPAGDFDADGIPDCIEAAQGSDPETRDNDVFADSRLFAMQQYRDFLGREGDAGGIAFWTQQVDAGVSRGQSIESFFDSAEFQGTIGPVARLYFAYFLRVPDYDGITFWAQYYPSNSLLAISNYFAGSPEFVDRYGALDHSSFVALVYGNVLGRAPDPGGHAFWTGQLDSGSLTRGQVMLALSESAEYQALTRNDVYVTMMYIGMLRRAPEPGGFSFWVDYLDQGNSGLALVNGFLGSAEYRARFLP